MKVKYTGNSDFQVFDASDFKKAELEGKKTTFARDVPTEVSDKIGEALTSDTGLFGEHSFEKVEEDSSEEASLETEGTISGDAEAVVEDELPTEGKAAKTEGTADAPTAGARSTGKGSSTRSR